MQAKTQGGAVDGGGEACGLEQDDRGSAPEQGTSVCSLAGKPCLQNGPCKQVRSLPPASAPGRQPQAPSGRPPGCTQQKRNARLSPPRGVTHHMCGCSHGRLILAQEPRPRLLPCPPLTLKLQHTRHTRHGAHSLLIGIVVQEGSDGGLRTTQEVLFRPACVVCERTGACDVSAPAQLASPVGRSGACAAGSETCAHCWPTSSAPRNQHKRLQFLYVKPPLAARLLAQQRLPEGAARRQPLDRLEHVD